MITPSQLADLWTQHAASLRLLARVRSDLSEDCVQEAFIRLSQQTSMPKDPLAWLVRVVRNCALTAIRTEQRRRRRESLHQMDKAPLFDGENNRIEDLGPDDAEQALNQLAPELREIVVAVIWTEMTFRQVSKAFDIPVATAHRRFREAMEALRELLRGKPSISSRVLIQRFTGGSENDDRQ